MKPKIIVTGGWIYSANDGDRHWVNSHEVARLYGINWKHVVDESNSSDVSRGKTYNWIWLKPDPYGEYDIAREIHEQIKYRHVPRAITAERARMLNLSFWQRLKFAFTNRLP